jgi:hypothetical protein
MNKFWKPPINHFKHSFRTESLDVENTYEAFVKWDGCIELTRLFNGSDDDDTIHICDLDDFIARLQELKSLGAKYFNNEEWK